MPENSRPALATFSRTTRALESENTARWAALLFGSLAVLSAWAAWFFFGQLGVYAVSASARLEVKDEAHPVAAPIGGRVVRSALELGREVDAGELLVELDSSVARLTLAEEEARRASLEPQLESLLAEISAEEEALSSTRGSQYAALAETRARLKEAETSARIAEETAARKERLKTQLSDLDLLHARAQAEERRAGAEALTQQVSRKDWERRQEESKGRAHLERLRRELALLKGELDRAQAAIARAAQEVEHRSIRAPVAGRLGGVAELTVGSVLSQGAQVAVIIPSGEVRVAADFLPADALGRVRPGQSARMRLNGFPWSQYGSLPVEVTQVASAVREGRVRVELAIQAPGNPRLPLAHALPGVVEVELERASPAELVLRAAGRMLEGEATPHPQVGPP